MKIDKFEKIWQEAFCKEDQHSRQWEIVSAKLKDAGILTDTNLEAFRNIWLECHSDVMEFHTEEMHQMVEILVRSRVLFAIDELESKYKLKVYYEEVFIRWIIDAYNDESINDAMKFFIDDLKLLPAHFSDITCQTLWRVIADKYTKHEPFDVAGLMNNIGFISYEDFYEFYFKEDDRMPPRQVFIEFRSLIDYAEKIIQLNELIAEELEKQDRALEEINKPQITQINPKE